MNRFTITTAALAFITAGSLLATDAEAASATPGFDISSFDPAVDTVSTRYKGPTRGKGIEVYLFGDPSGRKEDGFVTLDGDGKAAFSFSYDGVSGAMSSTLGNKTVTGTATSLFPADVLRFEVRNIDNNTNNGEFWSVGVTDLTVNGHLVDTGSFDAPQGTTGLWTIDGFNVQNTLTVSGTLDFDGAFNGGENERVRVQIQAGKAPAPIPLPAPAALLMAGIAGLGIMRRRKSA